MSGASRTERLLAARRPWGWTAADAGLALTLLLLMLSETLFNPEMTPQALLTALSLPLTLPLAWRAAQPVVVAVLVCLAHLAGATVATGPFAPQLAVLPLLIALFGAATRTRGPVAVATGGLTLALVVVAWVVAPDGEVDDFWPYLVWAGTWASGTFVRRRTDLAADHASRAALLEVEARTTAAESAAAERDRIARELHDVVAHSVSVMVVQAGAERLRLGAGAGPTRDALEAIEETGRAALTELRAMLGVLRDGAAEELEPLPRVLDVPALTDRMSATGLSVTLSVDPPQLVRDERAVPPGPSLAAYRIVQEALTNAMRHAPGSATRVDLTCAAGALTVRVENERSASGDGKAWGSGAAGRGLVGMRERAASLGGTFEVGPTQGGGFRVEARLPLGAGAL